MNQYKKGDFLKQKHSGNSVVVRILKIDQPILMGIPLWYQVEFSNGYVTKLPSGIVEDFYEPCPEYERFYRLNKLYNKENV